MEAIPSIFPPIPDGVISAIHLRVFIQEGPFVSYALFAFGVTTGLYPPGMAPSCI